MTPKEEALALFEKYLTPNLVSPMYGVLSYSDAKECALIAAKKVADECNKYFEAISQNRVNYWCAVIAEIEKL
jgi:hypothetical protein